MQPNTLCAGRLDNYSCSVVLFDSGVSSFAPRTTTSADPMFQWAKSTSFAKTARHLCSFSQLFSPLLLPHAKGGRTRQRQVRANGVQLCSDRQVSPSTSGDSSGMRTGGGRICLMRNSSAAHTETLAVIQDECQKRHGITHHSFASSTSSPCRKQGQHQLFARSRETINCAIVFQPTCPDTTHTITKPGESSRCLVEHRPSATMAWCQVV
ncbi:hypothetical protein TRVL_09001 [Trypanosoma vivax]|nr:hypothetical protein TRVL_09001 [Trypanosoma vivax]